MRNILISIGAAFVIVVMAGCHDPKEDQNGSSERIAQFKQVGAPIPLETAMRWTEVYNNQMKTSSRSLTQNFSASPEVLTSMTSSVTDLVGVAFHHAIDDNGVAHLLAFPIGESLSLFPSNTLRVVIDLNSGQALADTDATRWAKRYRESHPNEIWFHFFGKHVFDEIVQIPYFSGLDVQPAINDTDMSPQILLIIWDEASSASGRKSAESGTVYDASNPCPPCPVS